VSDISNSSELSELRLSDNKIVALPDKFKTLPSLSIIELGNNKIQNMK